MWSDAEVDALIALARIKSPACQAAVRSVLVDGTTQAAACRLHGVHKMSLSPVMRRIRRVIDLVDAASAGAWMRKVI